MPRIARKPRQASTELRRKRPQAFNRNLGRQHRWRAFSGLPTAGRCVRPGITQFTLNWCAPLIVENPYYPQARREANLDILHRIISAHPDVVLLHSLWRVANEFERRSDR